MKIRRRAPGQVIFSIASVGVFVWGLLVGCDSQAVAGASMPASLQGAATPSTHSANGSLLSDAAPVSVVDREAFRLEAKAATGCLVAKPCEVQVSLQAKAPYHINDSYPHKVKAVLPAPAGVRFPKELVGREEAKLTTSDARFPFPVLFEKAGTATVSMNVSFSVCTDTNCLMEKVALSATLSAK